MKRLLILAVLLLPACSNVKRELGIGRNSPDEFAVVKRAPLTLPPDYTLRPPGTAGAAGPDSANEARAAMLGSSAGDGARGQGEAALLNRLGADKADPGIRTLIDRDNGTIALKNKAVTDKLVFWKDGDADAPPSGDDVPASVLDAKAEAERLEKNKAEGKPVNAGDVPVIERKQSTFDKLFK